MEGAFAWIGHIAERLGAFIPRGTILRPTDGAIKFVSFRLRWWLPAPEIVVLKPGFHIWWPLASSFEIHPVVRQANDLRAQTIVTKDGKTVAVGGLIAYRVVDVQKLLAETFDPDDTIRDICLSAIHDSCIQYNLEDLLAASRTTKLDTAMRNEAKRQLEPYGVEVIKMALTDLAPCRVIRLVQSQNQGTNLA